MHAGGVLEVLHSSQESLAVTTCLWVKLWSSVQWQGRQGATMLPALLMAPQLSMASHQPWLLNGRKPRTRLPCHSMETTVGNHTSANKSHHTARSREEKQIRIWLPQSLLGCSPGTGMNTKQLAPEHQRGSGERKNKFLLNQHTKGLWL